MGVGGEDKAARQKLWRSHLGHVSPMGGGGRVRKISRVKRIISHKKTLNPDSRVGQEDLKEKTYGL